jgi:hypothetical protein
MLDKQAVVLTYIIAQPAVEETLFESFEPAGRRKSTGS